MAEGTPEIRRRRRPLEDYSKTWLGAVAVVVVVVLVGALLLVRVADFGYRHYTARFLQAAALQPGNPITVAGIPVGEVSSMKLVGDYVEAGLKVRDDVPLGEDSRASIKITTILGSRYLALYPDGPGSLPDDTFGLTHTEVPYDLQEALSDVSTTFEQVDSDQFAKTLAVLGKQLETLPPRWSLRRWRTLTRCRRSSPSDGTSWGNCWRPPIWSAPHCAASRPPSAA